MTVSDYVFEKLYDNGARHAFMLSGGGIMYLCNSLGHSKIKYVCCHHEQAAGIAAQAYAMKKNEIGVCLITTGPGGTNALTACGAAYMDSTPVVFLTGQVKRADFASLRGVRQFGAQENDIVSMAKPVTKYAVTVMDAKEIKYHLEKALFLALNGRQGPVWIDIPLDVQNEEIDIDSLEGFDPAKEIDNPEFAGQYGKDIKVASTSTVSNLTEAAKTAVEMLKVAKRPLILVGQGLVASGAKDEFYKLCDKLQIPVQSTWRVLDIMDFEDPLFYGSPGLQANRYSNLITQGCDFLLVLGSRLDNMITAFSERHFAFRAKKVIVDIDENEITKLDMPDVTKVVADIKPFLEVLNKAVDGSSMPDFTEWKNWCKRMKDTYPLLEEKQENPTDLVDLYQLSMKVSEHCAKDDTIVISSTSRCNTAGHMAFMHKKGQKTISSMAYGSMGFALPSVVGAYFGADENRVVMFEGDGSLQLNIQEFQTIAHHKINAKMFIFSNTGYAAIAIMQNRNFDGFHVGSDPDSGVTMPNLAKIAEGYGIPYFCITNNDEIADTVEKVFDIDGPVICEFIGAITFDEIPKCISSLDENGKRVSASLENPFPFLSDETMEEIYKGF